MVPGYSNGLDQGAKLPSNGTAADVGCVCCRERFSNTYWLIKSNGKNEGPYCAAHFPRPQ